MDCFKTAQWIWVNYDEEKDCYAEFYREFLCERRKTYCRLSCDGDYTLYINGTYAASGQYADFEHYKIYDTIDITPYLKEGRNYLAVLVWHPGEPSQKYKPAKAGLIYEVYQENATESILPAFSDRNTLCRKSKAYQSGYEKKVTGQLGYSFCYDANKEDEWNTKGELTDFSSAVEVEKKCIFYLRPIKKIKPSERIQTKILRNQGNYYLIDFGEEAVGIPVLEFSSPEAQRMRIDWGEHICDGHVRRFIQNRDFSFEYIAKPGKNEYKNVMFPIGARYLEIYAETPIELFYAGVCPATYPVEAVKMNLANKPDQEIYDICVNTLKLCMLDHYVDTPWREQGLYTFDSRNQMLCGYYAFENKNAEYVRSNLKLISEDCRQDGLLSITYPCGTDLTIPSYTLYYFMQLKEYISYTGDISLGKEVYDKLLSILEAFMARKKDGLVLRFKGANHWNFYDWSEYLSGKLKGENEETPDLMLNCLFILALENMQYIESKVNGTTDIYQQMLEESRKACRKAFYSETAGLFSMTQNGSEYTELGNAFAILAGLTEQKESEYICQCITEGKLSECSLAMKGFSYDALLLTDKERYGAYILQEIRRNYGKMLEAGATSVWETIEGEAAFWQAGSLCHGWSAIPIYYYHRLLGKEENDE